MKEPIKKRKDTTSAPAAETPHRSLIEETYEEVNSRSFTQNFRTLIHHYKKSEQVKVPRK